MPWWSFSKTVLAVCALLLVARGRLVLDKQIKGRPYTLRQLLQHRAGVRNYGNLMSYHRAVENGNAPWTVQQLLEHVEADRLDFNPNQGWGYSNVGYLFIRQIIEEVTGQDIEGALKHIVFDPLGFHSPQVAMWPEDLNGIAWGNTNHYHPGWVYHGLLVGTPHDATYFLHRLMRGDVLPAALLALMKTEHRIGGPLPGRPWNTTGYGLGLMMGDTSAGYAIGHSGCGPDSVNAVYHFPEHHCTISAFTQGKEESVAEQEVVRLARNSGD